MFEDTPHLVALRIFGATTSLLVAMLVFLHPEVMRAAMSHGMILVD